MTAIRLTRTLSAPITRVWTAFTDLDALSQWFWPESFGFKAIGQVEPGGGYSIRSETEQLGVSGEYQVVEAPRRLVFTWRWDGETEVSLVSVDLTDLGDSTELTLVHERLADADTRAAHTRGWNDCLDRLPGWLAGSH
jgi:uncharacterized protein YndB with AHSA1/START domain